MRVLIVYESGYGQAEKVARALAGAIAGRATTPRWRARRRGRRSPASTR